MGPDLGKASGGAEPEMPSGDPPPGQRPKRRGPMRFFGPAVTVLVAVSLLGLLAFGLLAQSPNTNIDDTLARDQATPAPAYRLAVLARGSLGASLTTSLAPAFADNWAANTELRGTPYVLNLWASWCVPCQEEAPLLERTWRQARSRDVLFVGLDQQDTEEDAGSFLRHYGIDYLTIRDPTNDVARKYGATGVPETFFISARGDVVNHVIGEVTPDQLSLGIAAAVAGRPQAARQGGARSASR